MRTIIAFTFMFAGVHAFSQVTGKVNLEQLGISFVIPAGWVGQQTESGYLLGSHTEAGMIILTSHDHKSLDELRAEASRGIVDEGVVLQLQNKVEQINDHAVAAYYQGSLQGQRVKAYGIGLLNPHGTGVTILAITTPDQFTDRHVQLTRDIADSFRFASPVAGPVIAEWTRTLNNARLTYLESYATDGGGYSNKVIIDLCGAGYFTDSRNYSMNVDTGGAFGSNASGAGGAGTWKVIPDFNGNAVLQLVYRDDTVREYQLSLVGGKTLLNGTQYFRTYDAACQ